MIKISFQQLKAWGCLAWVLTWTRWAQTSVTVPISLQQDPPSDLKTQPSLRVVTAPYPLMFSLFSSLISKQDPNSLANKVQKKPFPLNFEWKLNNLIICYFDFFGTGGVFEKLLPKEEYFSQALYTFDIGQNDLTAGYKLNMTTEQVKAYIPDVLGQFSNVIRVRLISNLMLWYSFLCCMKIYLTIVLPCVV